MTVDPGIPAGTVLTNTAGISYRGQTLGATFSTSSAAVSMPVMTPPQVSKTFSPNPVNVNGSATMKIVVSNPSSNPAAMTGVNFADSYPAGMVNSATPTSGLVCTAGSVPGVLSGGVAGGDTIGSDLDLDSGRRKLHRYRQCYQRHGGQLYQHRNGGFCQRRHQFSCRCDPLRRNTGGGFEIVHPGFDSVRRDIHRVLSAEQSDRLESYRHLVQ